MEIRNSGAKSIRAIILISLFVILSAGCASYNKKSLLEYDYPQVPQEYYTPYTYPYYYPYPYMMYPYSYSPYYFYSPYYYYFSPP